MSLDNFSWRDFSGGWQPSNDDRNGPRNALLKMDNLELDKNGALSLGGGTTVLGNAYGASVHSLFSNNVGATRHVYAADVSGNLFRDGISIGSGGDALNAAFSQAFNYTLIADGNLRKKDLGSGTPQNLGLVTPPSPSVVLDGYLYATALASVATTLLSGTIAGGGPLQFFDVFADGTDFTWVLQGQNGGSFGSNANAFSAVNSTGTFVPYTASPLDVFLLKLSNDIPHAGRNVLQGIKSITLDFLLIDAGTPGDIVTDYYTATIDVSQLPFSTNLTLPLRRGDFTKIGNSPIFDWGHVRGYRISIVGDEQFYISTLTIPDIIFAGDLPGTPVSPTNVVSGDISNFALLLNTSNPPYQLVQVNVNDTGDYVALSQISVPSGSFNGSLQTFRILPDISGLEAQVNKIRIFVRGGNLSLWYQILEFATGSFTVPQYWSASEDAVQTLGITINESLISVNSTGLTDKIFEIIGPIEGRWLYFTTKFMYPSDINNPDLYNPTLGVRTTGSNSEKFLWARRVSNSSILVGTSVQVYLLTGTFITLPDGTVDLYYRGLGCSHPPISYDATEYSGTVYYLASDGWRTINENGDNFSLVSPVTDALYRGDTNYGYSVNIKVPPGVVRFPVVMALNKLWCGITGQGRIEVLDPTRKYWKSFAFGKGDISAICSTQDGNILAFFNGDNKIRVLDVRSSLLVDGDTLQTINILSPVFDNSTPHQRKDTSTIVFRGYTGNAAVSIYIIDNTNTSYLVGTVTTAGILELSLDVSQVIQKLKTFQFFITGNVSNFVLEEIIFYFQTRPVPLTYLRIYNQNFGSAGKKRLRNWPCLIDTSGRTVSFTPINDNNAGTPTNLITVDKTTKNIFYKTDIFAVDYGGILYCSEGTFEFWDMMPPEIVQTLPVAKQFDQVGPEELFQYGKIRKFELRVLPFGTAIPIKFFMNDNSVYDLTITTISGLEQSYTFGLPPGVGGQIVRIEIGPTAFDFHRFYMRVQTMKTGKDTENEWVTLE